MPVIETDSYVPSGLLKSGHFNTIYPYLSRRKIDLPYFRKRLDTPDHDFIDIDLISRGQRKVAILCHGLEGSSASKYIMFTASLLSENGWDIIAMNYRGCSGEMNRKPQMYHSGFTDDLHFLVSTITDSYDEICIVGYSLGGNILCKYLGDGIFQLDVKIKAAVGVSVPCDLSAGARQIAKWQNYFYEKRFLSTLVEKIKLKSKMFPKAISQKHLSKIKILKDFDEYYTGPIHGFVDAEDYYEKCHCKQFLAGIKIPTLIISALDDPFLPPESYPYEIAEKNPNLGLLTPKYGGHVGFVSRGKKYFWEEEIINTFVNDPNSIL